MVVRLGRNLSQSTESSREADMSNDSLGFNAYGRILALSVSNGRRELPQHDAGREKLRRTLATLPWTIPATPVAESCVGEGSSASTDVQAPR